VARIAAVFIHGFLSSPDTWSRFLGLVRDDPDLAEVATYPFGYSTRVAQLNPLRRIPHYADIADNLRTFLSRDLADRTDLLLVSHSQGGLIAQRALARAWSESPDELARIRLLLMYACPNSGSDLVLPLRRGLGMLKNPQEAELRPLHDAVVDAQRTLLNQILPASDGRLEVAVYAGETDRVVPPASAKSVFPDAGVIPGDHFAIVQPTGRAHRSYLVFKHHVSRVVRAIEARQPTYLAPAIPPRAIPDPRRPGSPGDPSTVESPSPKWGGTLPAAVQGRMVDLLLEVPGMHDPAVRQQFYNAFDRRVQEQVPRNPIVRVELIGFINTLWRYRHLKMFAAARDALQLVAPDHPVVGELLVILGEFEANA
jgi:pimeloyl-ACP methyl ester carboxylesterase